MVVEVDTEIRIRSSGGSAGLCLCCVLQERRRYLTQMLLRIRRIVSLHVNVDLGTARGVSCCSSAQTLLMLLLLLLPPG